MTRTARVFGGVGLGQAHLAVVTVVGLWLTPFLLTRVGQHEYGLWLLGLQLVGYLQLLDFGVVGLLPRETAYARGRVLSGEDQAVVRRTIDSIRGVIRWQMPLVILGTVVAWWLIPDTWRELRAPFAWLLGFFVVTFPLRAYHAVLQGLQDLVFLGQLQIVSWVTSTLAMVVLVVAGHGLASLAIGWLVGQAVTFVACGWRLHRRYASVWGWRVASVSWTEAKSFFSRSAWVSTSQVAQVLLGGSDVLVIGTLLGPAAVVPYSCTAKLIQVLANHPQMLMQAAAPALSEMRMSESRGRLAGATSALTRAMLVVSGGLGCIVIAVNQGFVNWWVGPAQFGGVALTVLLVAAMLARHFNTTTVYTIFCFGHERRTALTALADGVVTVIASVILIRLFGVSGAAIGGLVGVLTVSVAPNLVVLAREVGVPVLARLSDLRGWFVRFGICGAVSIAIALVEPGRGIVSAIGRGALIVAIYAAVMVPFVLAGTLGGYVRQLVSTAMRKPGPPPASATAA
jgi:O-antigen/teichoic acid export membrane protein